MYQNQPDSITPLYTDFQIKILDHENWSSHDLDLLRQSIALFAQTMGGDEKFKRRLGEVIIERADTGTSLGLAYRDRIQLSRKTQFSTWSVVHELAHVWDAKNHWALSQTMEKYTGGTTSRFLSLLKKWLLRREWDADLHGAENKPGRYGRKPGVNAAGYFYGDKPSGANWPFNRREDFAESVVMYCGWGKENSLAKTAHGRIERYVLPNQTKDPIYGIIDNWSDYARYFYPENGDYTKTRRWKFINELVQDQAQILLKSFDTI
jgi:hypothetical protein